MWSKNRNLQRRLLFKTGIHCSTTSTGCAVASKKEKEKKTPESCGPRTLPPPPPKLVLTRTTANEDESFHEIEDLPPDRASSIFLSPEMLDSERKRR